MVISAGGMSQTVDDDWGAAAAAVLGGGQDVEVNSGWASLQVE